MKLVGDHPGNLALNGEDICQIAIVTRGPKMGVVAGVDQLCVHAYFSANSLYSSFEQMRYAELLPNLAQVAGSSPLVLHHACAADYFKVRDLGQVC